METVPFLEFESLKFTLFIMQLAVMNEFVF
jgi:hypothetical protein